MLQDFIINTVIPWIISFIQGNPTIAPLLVFLVIFQGALRIFFKPICALISQFVDSTPSPSDNLWWAEVQQAKWYKAVIWFVDWFTSIKLPGGK